MIKESGQQRSHTGFGAAVLLAGGLASAEFGQPWIGAALSLAAGMWALTSSRLSSKLAVLGPFWLLPATTIVGLFSLWVGQQRYFAVDVYRDLLIVIAFFAIAATSIVLAADERVRTLALRLLVGLGVLVSVVHLIKVTGQISLVGLNLEAYRLATGRGSPSQIVAIGLMVLPSGRSLISDGRLRRILLTICLLSAVLTFSRSLYIYLFIVAGILAVRTWLSSPRQRGSLVLTSIFILACLGASVSFITPPPAAQAFIEKVERSSTEVGSSTFDSTRAVTRNYRAYETERAVSQYESGGVDTKIFGIGWGGRVDLLYNTAATTAHFTRAYAPILHNGYAYFLLKTGAVGLLFIVAFLLAVLAPLLSRVGRAGYADSPWPWLGIFGILSMAIGTFVTGGLASPSGFGAVMCCTAIGWTMSDVPTSRRHAGRPPRTREPDSTSTSHG